jgi:ABC-type nitrate/sulfonate/bicarbonate transport system substrate-binding protein
MCTLANRRTFRALWAAFAGAGMAFALTAPSTAQERLKLTVFIGPAPLYDSVQMADSQGYLKAAGLDVTFQLFPTGTTALQTFRAGQGDLVTHGDLPAVSYWLSVNKDYRVISVIERDSKGYLATARKEIKEPKDLVGKTIATRVGSTGSFFISEYLKKNGIKDSDVKVINLDGQVLPTALCQGDISAFFIWEPFGSRAREICPDKVYTLSSAEGYIRGYAAVGARPAWLATKDGKEAATRFIRAMLKGADFAAKNFDAVAKYNAERFGLSEKATRDQWEINGRDIGLDDTFFKDFCTLAGWMRANGLMAEQFNLKDFIWTDGAETVDPKLVGTVPPPC